MGRGFREKPSPISWLGVWHDEAQAERKEPVQMSQKSDKNLSFVPARAQSVDSFHEASLPLLSSETQKRPHTDTAQG